MRIGFNGRLADEAEIRAGFIGCGSHSFRNIYPTFQFAPVRLVATCDLDAQRAKAFAAKFGAERAYDDYHRMLREEELDAVALMIAKFPDILYATGRLLDGQPRNCPCPRLMERYRKRGDIGPDWTTWVS